IGSLSLFADLSHQLHRLPTCLGGRGAMSELQARKSGVRPQLVLIYDGECPLCRRAVDWIRVRDSANAFEFLPCQAPEREARFPAMSQAQCLEAMQLALPDGRVLAGADALPAILERLRGWRALSKVLRLPGIRHLSPFIYRQIAKNRHHLSVIVARKKVDSPDRCGIDGACK
ncbi:MAG: DUF393 domain-containing protein, partial [Candidatus Hydrogenedentales bacterium]